MQPFRAQLRAVARRQQGSSLIETAVMFPFLLLAALGAIDFGRAYYASIEVQAAAEAGALYGLQNVTDTAGMQTAAKLDAPDVLVMTPKASWGCECADGSAVTTSCTSAPVCTNNIVNYVQVNTSATYTPLFGYPGIPSSFALAGSATMRAGQ